MSESAYARAGVDIDAGDRAVELMMASVKKTHRSEVIGGLGGFAGLFDASAFKDFAHPVLASSTDGVGTKVAIAQAMDIHNTIGWDLVGMLIDDLVVCGAEPLFLTDYIACGKVVPERIASIVSGIADACAANNTALLGGETAEHPGLLSDDEYDIAGATVGVVEKDEILGAHLVKPDDIVVAIASSGLHSNGYSLVRKVLLSDASMRLDAQVADLGRTLGEELLEPTRVYAAQLLKVIKQVDVHALSHITGGGFAANLARILPAGTRAILDRSTWTPAPIFQLVQRIGEIEQEDIETTLNMGVGMAVIVSEENTNSLLTALDEVGLPRWVCGRVELAEGNKASAQCVGKHPW